MLEVTSPTFAANAAIPKKHAYQGEGSNVSPALAWTGAPATTKEFALICDDPDAPRDKPWVHWVLYGMPAGTTSLPEGGSGKALQGKNDFGKPGWGGPMPPKGHGIHHYRFRVYALDVALAKGPGLTKAELLEAMKGHVVAEGELVGTYERR
ncbi:MAG: YbhB/YbcL family Raf kinase inhibitor-like protein [Candidatus Riflebacteria bacterium]|nr:YbhB/YbcL family Raf kinase inhibitor-like protein [Candidatus Riflebacteria bacterium]